MPPTLHCIPHRHAQRSKPAPPTASRHPAADAHAHLPTAGAARSLRTPKTFWYDSRPRAWCCISIGSVTCATAQSGGNGFPQNNRLSDAVHATVHDTVLRCCATPTRWCSQCGHSPAATAAAAASAPWPPPPLQREHAGRPCLSCLQSIPDGQVQAGSTSSMPKLLKPWPLSTRRAWPAKRGSMHAAHSSAAGGTS